MCGANKGQTPGVPLLYVQTRQPGMTGQGSLLQWIASRIPVDGSAQEGRLQHEHHEVTRRPEGMQGESGEQST